MLFIEYDCRLEDTVKSELTLLCGSTMNAPPPADSTIIAKNLGFTAQKVESQELFDTLMLS